MTKQEIEIGMRVCGGAGEDHDGGWVVAVIDDETVEVSWDSGVRTPAAIESLEQRSNMKGGW